MTPHLRAQAARFGVEVYGMERWAEAPVEALPGPLYVSLDLDGLDPAFAPGVAHPEPGGLSTRDVVGLLHRIRAPIAGGDVVELSPRRRHPRPDRPRRRQAAEGAGGGGDQERRRGLSSGPGRYTGPAVWTALQAAGRKRMPVDAGAVLPAVLAAWGRPGAGRGPTTARRIRARS